MWRGGVRAAQRSVMCMHAQAGGRPRRLVQLRQLSMLPARARTEACMCDPQLHSPAPQSPAPPPAAHQAQPEQLMDCIERRRKRDWEPK